MSSLDLFLKNAPVRDTFRPDPRKVYTGNLDSIIPKSRGSIQQHVYPASNTLADDKNVFLYQKDRFVFQPSASLTKQFGNTPNGLYVQPSFSNHPTETFMRPPEGLPLTGKQRSLRNFTKEPGMFVLIPGDLPDPQPREFISIDTITQRTIRDQVYSDGVPRTGAAMDLATEYHRNAGLNQGLTQLLQNFQNMPAAIAAQIAPLIPAEQKAPPSEISYGGLRSLYGTDAQSVTKLAEEVSINSAKARIEELNNISKNVDFRRKAEDIAKQLGVDYNPRKDTKSEITKALSQKLELLERLKDDRKKEIELKSEGRRDSVSSVISSVDEKNDPMDQFKTAAIDYRTIYDKSQANEKLTSDDEIKLRQIANVVLASGADGKPISMTKEQIDKATILRLMPAISFRLGIRPSSSLIDDVKELSSPEIDPEKLRAIVDTLQNGKMISEEEIKSAAKVLRTTPEYVKTILQGSDGLIDLAAKLQNAELGLSTVPTTSSLQLLANFHTARKPVTDGGHYNPNPKGGNDGRKQMVDFAKIVADKDFWTNLVSGKNKDEKRELRLKIYNDFHNHFTEKPASKTSEIGRVWDKLEDLISPLQKNKYDRDARIKLDQFLAAERYYN